MTEKDIIIIILGILVFSLIAIILFKNKNKNTEIEQNLPPIITNIDELPIDEETNLYYLKDETTGEIIGASENKEDLQFYINHPDYNPDPRISKSTNIEDFVSREEIE